MYSSMQYSAGWYMLLILSLNVLPRIEVVKIGISRRDDTTTSVMPKSPNESLTEFEESKVTASVKVTQSNDKVTTESYSISMSTLEATSRTDSTFANNTSITTTSIPIEITTLSENTSTQSSIIAASKLSSSLSATTTTPTKTTSSEPKKVDTTTIATTISTNLTVIPNTTATPTTLTESPTTILTNDTTHQNESSSLSNRSINHYNGHNIFCECNLRDNVCEMNCCCDADCNPSAFKVFDCFASSRREPLYSDFQSHPGLAMCSDNDGWLCIFRSNIQKEKQKIPEILSDTGTLYKWSSLLLEALPSPPMTLDSSVNSFYKLNQPILLIDLETREIVNFELPYAFQNTRCLIREPIKHLQSYKSYCQASTAEELQRNKRDLLYIIKNYRLLKTPIDNGLMLPVLSKENIIEMKIKYCILDHDNEDHDRNKCPDLTPIEVEKEEENYFVHEIEIIFKHNFTTLQDCELIFKNNSLKNSKQEKSYWQSFQVKFEEHQTSKTKENVNAKNGFEQAISGPLGYLQGQPIIIAHFTPLNASAEMTRDNRVLDYFQKNTTRLRHNHSLYMFSKTKNRCLQKNSSDNGIRFGMNEIRQCFIRHNNINDVSHDVVNRNLTDLCRELQRLAMEQLLGTISELQEIWISQLGRPQNDADKKWIRLEWRNIEFAAVVGVYNEKSRHKSFICRNMLLNIVYEFQVGAFTEQDISQQNMIKQATLTYGQRHDLEFALTELLELPLSISVMFYDYIHIQEARLLSNTAGERPIHIYLAPYLCFIAILQIFDLIK